MTRSASCLLSLATCARTSTTRSSTWWGEAAGNEEKRRRRRWRRKRKRVRTSVEERAMGRPSPKSRSAARRRRLER